MKLFRITSEKYAHDTLATGCLYANGRWHRKGGRVLYTSEHISLAKLEVLANSAILPKNQVLVTLEIPDSFSVKTIETTDLPTNWWEFPYPDSLADISNDWINEAKFWIMKVPSAQAFGEYNYLLNPQHPKHSKLKILSVEKIIFDKRQK